ncbi:MAG: lipid A biosynthesis acyltransferase [Betaproteobacteria bacterium]
MKASWHGQRERGGMLALRVISGIGLVLGRPITVWLMWPISLYFFLFVTEARSSSTDFLRRVWQRQPTRMEVWRHFRTFAVCLLDRLYFSAGETRNLHIEIEGADALQAIVGSGQGCLLIGSHLGNSDAVRSCGLDLGAPLKILMQIEQSPAMLSVLYDRNPEWRESLIPLGQPDTFLQVHNALEEGALVAMLGDRAYRQEKSIAMPFLGMPALFPTGPMLLAAITGKPVVMFSGLYVGDGRYVVHFEVLSDVHEFAGCTKDAIVKSLLSRYTRQLEIQCQRAPYNWYNFFDFWHDAAVPRN